MLTLYHAPNSRSTRIVSLIDAMDIRDHVEIVTVTVARQDGSGGKDPANPHPEGKVPLLVTEEGEEIRESNAIMIYLTDRFGTHGRAVGESGRGTYLSWMTWYGNVFEPVYVLGFAQVEHPVFTATWRGIPEAVAVLQHALSDGRPFLMGDDMTAADLLISSTYFWFRDGVPDVPEIAAWVDRCAALDCVKSAAAFDAAELERLTQSA